MTTSALWNPRYVAYAKAHGRTPEEMRAHDENAWPGGRMCGFMLWNSARWREWKKANGVPASADAHLYVRDAHAKYDAWLTSR
jgi:hypothetical protein